MTLHIIKPPHTIGITKPRSCSNEILMALLRKAFYPVGLLYILFILLVIFFQTDGLF